MTVVEYLREIRRSTDFKRVIRVVNLALGMITGMGSNNSSKGDNNSKGGSKGNKNNKGNTIITNDDSKVNNCNSKNDSKVNNCNSNNSNNSNNLHLDELLHRLGASYANTGNLSVIDQILQHVNSGSDDTRRHAVIALGLVIGYNTILIRQIMIPLATSHSMHVRAAAAICLGFFSTETVDESEAATVIGLLEALLFDTEDLVKQQAAIGIGIALQQYNEVDYTNKSSTPNFVRIAKWLNSTIANRVDSKCVKIGASLGRSLMELGGRSAILSIRNMNGQTDPFRVAAFQLMAHTWYWTPLTAIVSALVLPTPCIRLDSGNQTTETTTISTKYRETFVFMDETKRSRRFKRNKKEKIGNITRKHDGELKNMAKINYKDVIRRNRWNMIDWTGDS
ncbi:RPN2 [Enterospora canceri]|uniref:RPN2 n=1 Tax=Enterospora canceri TaxID=1081671 RepID=A0A1Y1S8S1_9MICR|nr:RPN2 [Enterospora canceri]